MKAYRGRAFKLKVAIFVFFIVLLTLFSVAEAGVAVNTAWKKWSPDYDRVELAAILEKERLVETDYQVLYEQTGLTKLGVDGLLQQGESARILEIQDKFFKERKVTRERVAPFSYFEICEDMMPHAILENGDIILTASTFVSYFRFGHSALVVDAERGELLEALEPGTVSQVTYKDILLSYSTFIIVRPKADRQVRVQAAKYAVENLYGIPYELTAGIFTKKYEESLKTTQCTHIIWWLYKRFGIDLDGNGGKIVKPQDILQSNEVEIVQVYGFPLDTLWR